MSHENIEFSGNPKKSPEYLEWKNKIVNKFRNLGMDIVSDEEYFIINAPDKSKHPQVIIHAWKKIPKKDSAGNINYVRIEEILEKYL